MKPRNEKEEYLLRQVQSLMPGVPADGIRLRVLDVFREDIFRGLLADAILHRLQPNALPAEEAPPAAIAILLSRFSVKAVNLARQYVSAHDPSLPWVVMDVRGRVAHCIAGQVQEVKVPPLRNGQDYRANSDAPRRMFSPNNQWLLKVLLLSGIGSKYWGGPAQPVAGHGLSDLAGMAGKPQPSVSNFLGLAERQDWLKRESERLVMLRIPQLLDQWSYHLCNNPDPSIPVGSIYPGEEREAVLGRLRGRGDAVIGGHAGAHLMGLGVGNVDIPRIHVRQLASGLKGLDLAEVPHDRALAILSQPKAVDAVFRGAVIDASGLPLADILQIYLDVRFSMARGEEQAEHIYERVLAPFFRECRWL